MSQKPPTEPKQGDEAKSMIVGARAEGRAHAAAADGKPLAIVAICQAYFRMVAQMAIKSGDPDEALDQLLDIHRASARLELQALREAVPSLQGARRQYLASSTDADLAVRAGRVQLEAGL